MSKSEASGWEMLAYLLASVVLFLPLTWWGGYVLATLWSWFCSPVFGGPAPGPWQAAGLLLVFRYANARTHKRDDPEPWYALITSALLPALALAFGWLIKAWAGLPVLA